MNYFLKHKTVIARSLGACMLIIGFAIHFWVTPKEGLSTNDKAAARVARMEASAKGKSSAQASSSQKDSSKFIDKLKNTQEKQMEYLTIIAMIMGIGFLAYSFIPRKEEE